MNTSLPILDTPEVLARLQGRRLVCAELMYKPRPDEPRARHVFDFTLQSRLSELCRYDDSAVVFVCDSAATADSLAHLRAVFPQLPMLAAIANPEPLPASPNDPYRETPTRCGWHNPQGWRRCNLTDRWTRILFALNVVKQLPHSGYLILPAHDAVWGRGLLDLLMRFSERHAANGIPAAVSPYTYYQHSRVPGVEIPRLIIDALNAAFARDSRLRWRFRSGRYQAYWGKMGMIPFVMCGELVRRAETMVWEDDLEIDRALREAGYSVRTRWIDNPALYRQALPVFDRDGLRAVINRTLHYSLNIPGKTYGETSVLNLPLDRFGRLRRRIDPRFARALALSEAITAECMAGIAERIRSCGASWVDWGAYRYAVRVGDPLVQVWKYDGFLL